MLFDAFPFTPVPMPAKEGLKEEPNSGASITSNKAVLPQEIPLSDNPSEAEDLLLGMAPEDLRDWLCHLFASWHRGHKRITHNTSAAVPSSPELLKIKALVQQPPVKNSIQNNAEDSKSCAETRTVVTCGTQTDTSHCNVSITHSIARSLRLRKRQNRVSPSKPVHQPTSSRQKKTRPLYPPTVTLLRDAPAGFLIPPGAQLPRQLPKNVRKKQSLSNIKRKAGSAKSSNETVVESAKDVNRRTNVVPTQSQGNSQGWLRLRPAREPSGPDPRLFFI